jgi:phosphate transport system protein
LLSWLLNDFYLRKWDMQTGKAVLDHRTRPQGVELPDNAAMGIDWRVDHFLGGSAFTPQGDQLLLASQRGDLHYFDVESGKEIRIVNIAMDQAEGFATFAFSSTGKHFAVANRSTHLRVGHLGSGMTAFAVTLPGKVSRAAFLPDGRSVAALVSRDDAAAKKVIEDDDPIDDLYLSIDRRTLEQLALQTPVAGDLRLLSVILHTNSYLERVGDQAVNIAKIYLAVRKLPSSDTILAHLQEMSDVVRAMIRVAMQALARRDLELCLKLPAMDDPVDRLNLGMYKEVAALAEDPGRLNWGLRMNVVARQLERVGDNAVDIGEQVGFLLTGEFREFTDASHPELDIDGS